MQPPKQSTSGSFFQGLGVWVYILQPAHINFDVWRRQSLARTSRWRATRHYLQAEDNFCNHLICNFSTGLLLQQAPSDMPASGCSSHEQKYRRIARFTVDSSNWSQPWLLTWPKGLFHRPSVTQINRQGNHGMADKYVETDLSVAYRF